MTMEIHPIIIAAASCFMLTAAVSDMRHRRISNRLNVLAAVSAFGLQAVLVGTGGVLAGLQGLAAGLVVLFIPFAMGMIGGGDVKFVAAVGAFFGARVTMTGLFIGVMLGGVVGAVSLLRKGRFTSGMRSVTADLACLAGGVRPTTLKDSDTVETVPYGVLLALGMVGGVVVAVMEEVPWVSR